jgi:hypothetical protein
LARRTPWNLSNRLLSGVPPVSDIQEPHWKTACRRPVTTATEVQQTRSFGQSRIPGRAQVSRRSVPKSDEAVRPHEQADDGLAYTQMLNERRTATAQTKKRIIFRDLIGGKSELDEFAASLPPSRRVSRHDES